MPSTSPVASIIATELYLALFFYSFKKQDKKLMYFSMIFFILSMYVYGFTTDGKPRGFLVDTFAIYATVFSPLLFIYFIYSLYRAGVKDERTITWYISMTAMVLSIIFSLIILFTSLAVPTGTVLLSITTVYFLRYGAISLATA